MSTAPGGTARPLDDTISGTWRTIPGGAELDLKNESTRALMFDRGSTPGGQTLTDASQDGKPCQVFGGTSFHCGPFNVAGGKPFAIVLHSPQAFASDPFTINVSWDGQSDHEFVIPLLQTPPPPPPPPPECRCLGLKVALTRIEFNSEGPKKRLAEMHFDAMLHCSGGTRGCSAVAEISPATGTDLKHGGKHRPAFFNCESKCRASAGTFVFHRKSVLFESDEDLSKRAGKTFVFPVSTECDPRHQGNERHSRITVVFQTDGSIDRRKSDLDGNGKRDGK